LETIIAAGLSFCCSAAVADSAGTTNVAVVAAEETIAAANFPHLST